MIFGDIKCNENISSYPMAIQKAINYLKENDLVAMEPGRYELDGDNMILQVLDVQTTERCNLRPEVHETYIDVQFLARGKEKSPADLESAAHVIKVMDDILEEYRKRY